MNFSNKTASVQLAFVRIVYYVLLLFLILFSLQYCHCVFGLVFIGLSRLFVASGLESEEVGQDHKLANSLGLFLQKTNIIRDYLEDVQQGRLFWPKEVYIYAWNSQSISTWELLYRPKSKQCNTTNLNISFFNEKRAAQVGFEPTTY